MAEFTELPIAAGPLVPRVIYNELLNAINNRRAVVLPDATAAFTIHNTAGDATSATVEIDTAADEIYLIVVGGASASNTTLDLTAAANDTITELVAVINALGFAWVAVETSGAQSAHANNKSETLLSSGPADCLGASHITWFTNYAPNGVHPNSLIGNVVAYRAAIDALVNYFYPEVGLAADTEASYTANTLHNEAFGDNNWNPAGAPNLTPPCLPHEDLWNNMKLCLDLLVWIRVDTGIWDNSRQYNSVESGGGWNATRATWFANAALDPGVSRWIGRRGVAWKDGDYTINMIAATGINLATTFTIDFSTLINVPDITSGYLGFNFDPGFPPPPYHLSDLPLEVTIEATDAMTAAHIIAMAPDNPRIELLQLDDMAAVIAAGDWDLAGANNDMKIQFSGNFLADIGVGEWPAPPDPLPDDERWIQSVNASFWRLYMKLSWD